MSLDGYIEIWYDAPAAREEIMRMKFRGMGSIVNAAMVEMSNEPKVGMGATILHWSDRSPATIVRVTKATITVREDRAVVKPGKSVMTDAQEDVWNVVLDPDGRTVVFRRTKDGKWRSKVGDYLRIGQRGKYVDPSF